MPDEVADEVLLARYADGDLDAFGRLMGRYERPVYRFVRRFLNDHQQAEDVYQEVFVRVIRSAASFQRGQTVGPWLFRIARNLCIDTIRREGYRRALSLDQPAAGDGASGSGAGRMADGLSGREPHPGSGAEHAELSDGLQQALDELPPEQRELVLLKEVAGLTFREAAVVTGTPESTLKSRMAQALDSLRRILTRRQLTPGD